MADWDFDLLGDLVPVGQTGRGRPPHVATIENRQKCVLLAAVGRTPDEIAAALSITAKTLRKHYSRELRDHDAAKLKVEGKLLAGLVREIDKGNVAANKELAKRLDRAGVDQAAARVVQRSQPVKAPKLGKKEQAKIDAQVGASGRLAPRPAPLLN